MVNRPNHGPCSPVHDPTAGSPPGKFYLASTGQADVEGFSRCPSGFFGLHHVEPFLVEEDAIAAALLCDAYVDRIEEDEHRPYTWTCRP